MMRSVEISSELYKQLELIAGSQGQSVETAADEAIRAYVEMMQADADVKVKNDNEKTD